MLVTLILHASINSPYIPEPAESHAVFGAAFLLLGALMAVECLAGGVWHRSQLRTLFFPITLMCLAAGMLAVTAVEPNARLVHLSMGLPMAIGGWAEARVRFGQMRRIYADIFIVPALFLASVDTAGFHLGGPPANGVFMAHLGVVVMGLVIAGLRFYQSREPASLNRGLMLAGAVALVGMILFLDGLSQVTPATTSTSVSSAPPPPASIQSFEP